MGRRGALVCGLFAIGCGDPAWEAGRIGTGDHPRLAVAGDGRAVATWIDGGRLRARAYDPALDWGETTTLHDLGDVDPFFFADALAVASNRAGAAVVAWPVWTVTSEDQNNPAGRLDIFVAAFDPDTGWREPEIVVTFEDGTFDWPGVVRAAIADDGTATVAIGPRFSWSLLEVIAVRGARGAWSEPTTLTTGAVTAFAVAATGTEAIVAWGERQAALQAARYDDDAWTAPEPVPGSEVGGAAVRTVHLGIDGAAWLAWRSNDGVQVSRAAADGIWAAPELLDAAVADPLLAVDEAGGAVAAWSNAADDAYAVRYAPAAGWSDAERIGGGIGGLRVAGNRAGDTAAIWYRGGALEARRTSAGAGWSEPLTIDTADAFGAPAIAVDDTGTVTAVWRASTCDDVTCDEAIMATQIAP